MGYFIYDYNLCQSIRRHRQTPISSRKFSIQILRHGQAKSASTPSNATGTVKSHYPRYSSYTYQPRHRLTVDYQVLVNWSKSDFRVKRRSRKVAAGRLPRILFPRTPFHRSPRSKTKTSCHPLQTQTFPTISRKFQDRSHAHTSHVITSTKHTSRRLRF